MNHFEFYQIPISFFANQAELKKVFYANSKAFHPDYFINETEEKQTEILGLSTQNNEAYKILSNFDKRLEYILSIYNQLAETEKHVLPQEFLMEMMDINEQLMELEGEKNDELLSSIENEIQNLQLGLDADLTKHCEAFDQADESNRNSILFQIKDIYFRKKYLLRIKDSLNKFAN